MIEITLIAAISKNNVIGKDNKLPWHLPEDLKHFKELTINHAVVMGRKTYDSILETLKHPLTNRYNIVITRNEYHDYENVYFVNSLELALKYAEQLSSKDEIFVIGGESIYKQAMPIANKLEITLINREYDGDTFFPKITNEWKEIFGEDKEGYSFLTYKKS